MKGTDRLVADAAIVRFSGSTEYEQTIPGGSSFRRVNEDQGDILVELPVEEGFWNQSQGSFNGEIEIVLFDEIGDLAVGTLEEVFLTGQEQVPPNLSVVPGGMYFVNQAIDISGTNFLRPNEGTTWAVVSGDFSPEMGASFAISNAKIPVRWTGSRTSASFVIDPAAFGVQLGSFSGSLSFENELRTGDVFAGNVQSDFQIQIQQSFMANFKEDAGSRGQRIEIVGRGFVVQNPAKGYGMFLRFDGEFAYDDGSPLLEIRGPDALQRTPDEVLSDQVAVISVWYEISGNRLFGIGANPGVFRGSVTPVLFDERGEQEGLGWQGEFRVLPTKQMVYIKYLPGFTKGLEKYGISNIEFEIRKKILEFTNRDYSEVNVEFVNEVPLNFIDYATIEVGGPDPTGGNKFGYDNTCNVTEQKCKDTDNLFLGDYLGGVNQNSASEYDTPFGGVFIESFDYFSPTLTPENEDASQDFDRILGPFMPALGGKPVLGTEYPLGDRDQEINTAIGLVSAVIANTVTHEVGHSLGLAFFPQDRIRPGEQFHNRIPCDWCIMDSGSQRPFEERGEIVDGIPVFKDRNLNYLKDILPIPTGL